MFKLLMAICVTLPLAAVAPAQTPPSWRIDTRITKFMRCNPDFR